METSETTDASDLQSRLRRNCSSNTADRSSSTLSSSITVLTCAALSCDHGAGAGAPDSAVSAASGEALAITALCSSTAHRTSCSSLSTAESSCKLRSRTSRRTPVSGQFKRFRQSGHLGAPLFKAMLATIQVLMQDLWKRCRLPHRSSVTSVASAPRQMAQVDPSAPKPSTSCSIEEKARKDACANLAEDSSSDGSGCGSSDGALASAATARFDCAVA